MKALLAIALLAALAGTAAAQVPPTISFSARLVDDATGKEVTGSHQLTLELFDAEVGGTALYTEGRQIDIEDGLVFVEMGSVKPLESVMFDGRKLFLQVSVDDAALEPRVALSSVPYALRSAIASDAETLGGVSVEELQSRITGTCGSGNFIIGVNVDGTVACAPDLSGSGDITDVIAGSGLQGGGAAGNVTLALINCGANEILKFNGSAWTCAADANSGGDITAVNTAAGGGLVGGAASGDVGLSLLMNCGTGQLLKFQGGSWVCANDIDTDTDTNSGGDITAVLTGGNSGLVGGTGAGDANISLLTSCAPNQILKFNGTAWGCAADVDTDTNSGGDITDVTAGLGLTGGAASGNATLDVGQGTGIIVGANAVSLDTGFTDARYDPRYVNTTGDTMSGNLDMAQSRVLNRGCPPGYVRHGPGLCLEDIDEGGLTFSTCANKCRAEPGGAHLCSSAEMRSVMQSGVTIGNGGAIGDWVDDQDTPTTALVVGSNTDPNAMLSVAQTDTTRFCRCCTNVE